MSTIVAASWRNIRGSVLTPGTHREKLHKGEEKKGKRGELHKPGLATKPSAAPPPVAEAPPPAYEPQLLRLSEIMGSLAYLQTICAEQPAPAPVNAQTGRHG